MTSPSRRPQGAGFQARSTVIKPERLWPYLLLGILLGIVFTRSGVISWFRIQEMFRFQSFHMYGVIGSAVMIGAISVQLIKRLHMRSITNRPIEIPDESFRMPGWQYWMGGTAFGLGWGLIGACPGPMYAQLGAGEAWAAFSFIGALCGAYLYAWLRPRLPH